MSVAASLAALQQTVKRPSQRPSSISRSELAASARNAISVLQRADQRLAKLIQPLLLLSPELDRLTLAPEAERKLQSAVVELIMRIAPVFPLRSTQSLLDWLLIGLSLGTHGSDEEYDNLIISALPFSEQQPFVRLVKRMAPLRPKWEFLWPVVKQSKPPTLSFMIKNVPQHLFPLIMDYATQSASFHLHASPLSSFLANTLTRRILILSDAPILTLACVNSLQTIASKKFLNKSKSVPVNLVAALLSALAVTMSAYLVDHSLLQAASHACACVLLKCKEPELRRSAASCLVLTSSTLSAFVPSKVARTLLRHSELQSELKRLDPSDASSLFCALVLASVGKNPKTIRWSILKECLALQSFLTKDAVRICLVNVMDKISPELEPEGIVRERAVEGLAALLEPLARGRFTESVDLALREHFNRREEGGRKDRYAIVDEALAKGLFGTQFASINTSEKLHLLPLCAALDHPEPSVRRTALEQFAANTEFKLHAETDTIDAMVTKLTEMVRLEQDLGIVSSACDCVLKISRPQDYSSTLSFLVARYIDEHEQLENMPKQEIRGGKKKKKKRKIALLSALFSRMLMFCRELITEHCGSIHALLSGVIVAGYLPDSLSKGDKANLLDLLSKHWKMINLEQPVVESNGCDIKQHVVSALEGMLWLDDIVLTKFCDDLKDWNGNWVLNAAHLWLPRLGKETQSTESEQKLKNIFQVLANLVQSEDHLVHQVALTLSEYGKLLCEIPSSSEAKRSHIESIWSFIARDGSDQACKSFLSTIVSEFNLATCIEVLKDASVSSANQRTMAVSLKWYVNLCVLHPKEETRKEAMIVLLTTLYGNDTEMQKTILEVCGSSISEEGMEEQELRTEFWTFLTMLSKLPKNYTWEPQCGNVERAVSTEIHRRVIAPIKTPPSLLYAKRSRAKVPVNLTSLMRSAAREKENQYALSAYLRALYGYRVHTEKNCRNLISLLISSISRMSSSTEEQSVILENVARLTQTFALAPAGILSNASTLSNLSDVTLSALKHVSSRVASSDESCEKSLATLLGLSALLVNVHKESKANRKIRLRHLAYLFSFSTSSSRLGNAIRGSVDILCENRITMEELVVILRMGHESLSPTPKRRKISSKNPFRAISGVARSACRGVLEALLRWTSKNEVGSCECLSGPLDELKHALFDLLKSSLALKEDGHSSMDDLEYEMSLLLQVQALLYTIRPSRSSQAIEVAQIASVARYARDEDEDTLLTSAVRKSAVRLLEVLAPIHGAEVQDALTLVIESLVSSGDASQTLLSLKAFLPALIESGCSFESICSWVIDSSYSNGSLSDSGKGRKILSSSCKLVSDPKQAVMTSVRYMEGRLMDADEDLVARECASLLLDVELGALDDVHILQILPARIRCRAAFTVLQSPVFMSKLFSKTENINTEEETVFCTLFLELLVCDDTKGRRDAVAALAAILPLSVFEKSVLQGLNSKDAKIRTRTMNVVRERFETEDSPISYSWNMDEDRVFDTQVVQSMERSFLSKVGRNLCNISRGTHSFATYDERILAASTLDRLVITAGSLQRETILSFADSMLDLLRVETVTRFLSQVETKKAECQLASNCMVLFTSLVGTLGKHAVPFVPEVLASALGVLEKVFNPTLSSSGLQFDSSAVFSTLIGISEAAIKLITAVLDNCPSFLGARTLQGLISLNLGNQADVLSDLLRFAMSSALPGTIATALSKTTKDMSECEANFEGIASVMRALSCGLDRMHKGEVSLHMDQFVQSIISFLEYGREAPNSAPKTEFDNGENGSNPHSSAASLLSDYREVDQSCNEALTSLIYKLPESKFKKLFNKLVQWCDGGSLSSEMQNACEAMEEDLIPNVTRASPFYRLVQHLSEKLRSIMVPYVFEILEDVLKHVSRKQVGIQDSDTVEDDVKSSKRKRKRYEMEEESRLFLCSVLAGSHEQVVECCLEIVISLLKQNLGAELFTATVAAKILDSLLAAFDNCDGESERVSQALCSLASRITACGKAAESRDESREQLTSFSRSLLLRTRETGDKIRAAALRVSCAVAQVVGDEYLVTLPESMPVLAEVIDDEHSLVRKEAKRYIRILEGLAGENIMDQLK
eukprot:TRINITY_DN113_c0_g1_i1.p1 TRINITY_DN113_c0_g1~~TRINITY_DN113_c0_g1_i1.p1  ORF type:complete len:2091 (+),score=279.61 TRINITY_DN113_c0_g1_i1:87-6359(+)